MSFAVIPKSNDFAGFALANAWRNLAEGVYPADEVVALWYKRSRPEN